MKTKVKMAKLLIKINTTLYTKFVTTQNGKNLLYADIIKYLYRLIKAEPLFYKELVQGLKDIIFKLKQQDPCFANRVFNE